MLTYREQCCAIVLRLAIKGKAWKAKACRRLVPSLPLHEFFNFWNLPIEKNALLHRQLGVFLCSFHLPIKSFTHQVNGFSAF